MNKSTLVTLSLVFVASSALAIAQNSATEMVREADSAKIAELANRQPMTVQSPSLVNPKMQHNQAVLDFYKGFEQVNNQSVQIRTALGNDDAKTFDQVFNAVAEGMMTIPEIAKVFHVKASRAETVPSLELNIAPLRNFLVDRAGKADDPRNREVLESAAGNLAKMLKALPNAEPTVSAKQLAKK